MNFWKAIYLKKWIIFLCINSIGAFSNISAKSSVNNNDKHFIDTLFQDTVVNISGKIVDSLTNDPIPFATITFFKGDTNSMTVISKENGTFSNDTKHLITKVRISAIGYQEQIYELITNSKNLILLKPVNNTLPNVIVSSKAKKLGRLAPDFNEKKWNKKKYKFGLELLNKLRVGVYQKRLAYQIIDHR
jgi:hypothetical protein